MGLWRKLLGFVLITLLASFFWSFFPSMVSAQTSFTVHNLNTGYSYESIQEAVDDNSTLDGHVIRADANTYYEQVVLYKALFLVGENPLTTTIDGMGNGTVIDILASNANVTGFTIRNSSSLSGSSGIHIHSSSYCNVTNNVIVGNWYGVWLESSNSQIVSENEFTNNQNAVYVDSSTEISVSNNNFSGNDFAVWMSDARTVDFESNNVTSNNYAVWITQSTNLSLSRNWIKDNIDGLRIYSNSSNVEAADNSIHSGKDYAISLNDCLNCSVAGNDVWSEEKEAIYVRTSDGNSFAGNTILSNGYDGIHLDQSDDNIINGNVVSKSANAIAIYSSVNNVVSGNNLSGNEQGIVLSGCERDSILGNEVLRNSYGINISNSRNIQVEENNVAENLNEGVRIEESHENTISDNSLHSNNGYGLVLTASNNNTISNNIVSNNTNGVFFERSFNDVLSRNTVSSSDVGILWLASNSSTVAENNLFENNVGFVLNMANFNLIYGNRLTGNTDGFKVLQSRNNTLRLNVVSSNLGVGIYVADSSFNFFLHNDFSNNSLRPAHVNSSDRWDDGIEGNFWGYEGFVDANQNGIADAPFVLGDGNKDNFPLMAPYVQVTAVLDSQQYLVGVICNTSISNFRYVSLSNLISFRVSEFQGLGLCRVSIPRALIQPPFEVTVDNEPPLRQALVYSNATHSWLYFSFPYVAGNVRIVKAAPAPPFWTELWFIGIVVLAAIVSVLASAIFLFYRRLGSYRKTIDEFERKLKEKELSPLEEARRLFNVDVAKRGVKIGKFEEKYGVKIRPRDSLEDIFRALESKRKEMEEKDEVNS